MPNQPPPVALVAIDAPKRIKPSNYPEPFASQMQGRSRLPPGMCAGFKAGTGNGHRLLEMGGRSPGDAVIDPGDDTKAVLVDGKWFFSN